MASRAIFNTQILNNVKRSGARFQSTAAHQSFAAERDAVKHHAADAANTWKKISIFVCIPALLAAGVNAYNLYSHHHEHAKEHPKEWVKYEYINWRAKDFFWGKNSLFFNPEVNLSAEE